METSPKSRRLTPSPKTSSKKLEEELNEAGKSEKEEGESSPARCPICLAPPENPAKSDSCSHYFCFSCLKEWSKVKAECPLCKTPIHSIIYGIKSDNDYQEYRLKEPGGNSTSNFLFSGPFNADSIDFFAMWQERREQYFNRVRRHYRHQENEMAAITASSNIDIIRTRRIYYWDKTRVRRVDTRNRVRDISAEFFQNNPSQLHRLEPWVRRELVVLYGAHNRDMISRVRQVVMSTALTRGITSPAFAHALQPYLLEHTNQFIHELASFAKSPYDIHQYDSHAHYSPERPRRDWAPRPTRIRRSRWDSSPDSGNHPRGSSSQSLMLSQTAWEDDEAVASSHAITGKPRGYPHVGSRRFGMDHFTTIEMDDRRGFFLNAERPRNVDAPLQHQRLLDHRAGGSSARDYHRMEIMRRHYGEHLQRNEIRSRQVEDYPLQSVANQINTADVIVISSDSSENEESATSVVTYKTGSNTLHYKPSTSHQPQDGSSVQRHHIKKEQESKTQSDSSSSRTAENNSDSDIEFVKYVKPPHLRTPDAFIDLSSASEDEPGPSNRHNEAIIAKPRPSVTSSTSSSSDSSSDEGIGRYRHRKSSSGSSGRVRPLDVLHRTKEFFKKARLQASRVSSDTSEIDVVTAPSTMSLTNDATEDCDAAQNDSVPSKNENDKEPAYISMISAASLTSPPPQNDPTVMSQNKPESGLKKVFERGKVSVNFPKPKKDFYDSDSGSEIDVGVEEVRPLGMYARRSIVVDNSSHVPSNYGESSHDNTIMISPSRDSIKSGDGTSQGDRTQEDQTLHKSRKSSHGHKRKQNPEHSSHHRSKHRRRKHKHSRSRKNSRNSEEIFTKTNSQHHHDDYRRSSLDSDHFSSRRHKKSKKSRKSSKYHRRSRSSSVEFVTHIHRS